LLVAALVASVLLLVVDELVGGWAVTDDGWADSGCWTSVDDDTSEKS
jgi:hypothetical protein